MKLTQRLFRIHGMLGVLLAGAALCHAADSRAMEYGRYLVEEVAECGDCHTPRNETGSVDESRRLKGAILDSQPSHEIKNWRKAAPDLTSSGSLFAQWGEEGMVKFLETGLGPKRYTPGPPMPAYKLRPHDAQAIVTYLKSLK